MKTKPKSRLANTMTTYRVGAAMLATVGMAGIGSNSARAADGQVPFPRRLCRPGNVHLTAVLQFRGSGHWVVTAGTGRFDDATVQA
jgi:hypothetical protein